MRGSTCSYPFTAPLSCMYGKPPAENKRTHKSEYSSQRVWSNTVKFVRLSKKKKKKLQNLWKLSNYLLKPQGEREVLHSGKPSSLLSISARLSLLSVALQQKSSLGKLLAVSEFVPQHFIDAVKRKVFGLLEHFLRNTQLGTAAGEPTQPSWSFNRLIWLRIFFFFFGQCRKSFHCRYCVSRSKMASRIK